MNVLTGRLRPRLISLGALLAALGLVFAIAPAAHAVTYEKKIANWASGNDPGGRDASARLVTSGGDTHYKVLFRANDEIVHLYDNYDENAGPYDNDVPGVAEVRVYNTKGVRVVNTGYAVTTTWSPRSYELSLNGDSDIPEGYKIQLRMCVDTSQTSCTPWVYGIA